MSDGSSPAGSEGCGTETAFETGGTFLSVFLQPLTSEPVSNILDMLTCAVVSEKSYTTGTKCKSLVHPVF